LDDTFGKVIKINWRAIRIETIRGDMVVIPHLMMAQAAVKNYNQPTRPHYMTFEIGFDYHVPPNEVKDILVPVCLATPSVLHDPPPAVKLIEYKESTVLYEIEFAIYDFWEHEEILDDMMTRCWYAMHRAKLAVPVAQWVDHFPHRGLPKSWHTDKKLEEAMTLLPRFMPIRANDFKYIEQGTSVEVFGRDELVIAQGRKAGDIFIVLSGTLNLTYTTSNVETNEIVQLQRGDIFGEIPSFTGKKCTFSVVALTDVEVIKIAAYQVADLVQMNNQVSRYLDDLMNMRLRMLQDWEAEEEVAVADEVEEELML